MRGGFTYKRRLQKKSRPRSAGRTKKIYKHCKRARLSKCKKIVHKCSKFNRHSKRNKYNKRNKHNKRTRRYKQNGGNQLDYSYLENINNEIILPRLAEGPHFNTVQGYGANLSNPPVEGIETVSQCNNM